MEPKSTGVVAPLLGDMNVIGALIDMSGRSVRRLDADGLMPRSVRCGGSVKWRLDEIRAWVDAGCPDRETWEALITRTSPGSV